MTDLFDWTLPPKYPEAPGFKEPTTSKAAARRMRPRAQTIRDQVLVTLRTAWPGGMSADQVAAKMGKSVLSVRPRISELRELAEIMPSTRRVPNESGVDAIVWVCRRPEGDA
jgi:hypothetical protein